MINLTARSYQKEILDNDSIPFADIRQNMKELNTINTYLGGHKITLDGVKLTAINNPGGHPLHICEIGCGGGDNLKAVSDWCNKQNIAATFTGIDIKPECIAFASEQYPAMNTQWITSDYKTADLTGNKPDIIFSSLFCHHFTEAGLQDMLQWMQLNSRLGFFINDLQRHRVAYYAIKWITRLFSSSYLVKHDAPLSVARGFTKKEWQQLFEKAGMKNYSIRWKWAFRYLISCTHD
jgi:2-polyprenyl-3-methyl-5-hydroxy-6-metoxy-1,4-benzoquinol methylase